MTDAVSVLVDVVDAIASHAGRTGLFGRVQGAEPKSAPTTGRSRDLVCAVWVQRVRPAMSSGLASSSVVLDVTVRLYMPGMSEPQNAIDPAILRATDVLCKAYVANLDLGLPASVRSVDVRGMAGQQLEGNAGWLTIDQTTYRVMTIVVPVIVNDLWPESQ